MYFLIVVYVVFYIAKLLIIYVPKTVSAVKYL